MTEEADRLSEQIAAIPDLSLNTKAKWDLVYPVVQQLFDATEDETYLTYIGKASNAQVRLAKQMPTEKPIRVALGVCGTFGDWESQSYPAQATRAIKSRKALNAIVFIWRTKNGSHSWTARYCYHRPGAPEAETAANIWPDIKLVEISSAGMPSAKRQPLADGDFTQSVVRLLCDRKNVVLEGVPGTGKSYAINGIVKRWQSITGRVLADPRVIVMHPSSSYEDLVEGLRPAVEVATESEDFLDYPEADALESGFVPRLGRLAEAAALAAVDPQSDHLLVLDELNRANVPKTLGELLLVMEATKRAHYEDSRWIAPTDGCVRLTYTGTKFWLPDNLYILATMNTTDRSVAPLDAALRRRFVFKRIEPLTEEQVRASLPDLKDEPQALFDLVADTWTTVNEDLLRPVIGPDAVLGHSYLFELHEDLARAEREDCNGVVESFLRYTYLPQFIDSIASNGREAEIFDLAWGTLGEAPAAALTGLDALLELFDMKVTLEGEGLSRRLSVVAREPAVAVAGGELLTEDDD